MMRATRLCLPLAMLFWPPCLILLCPCALSAGQNSSGGVCGLHRIARDSVAPEQETTCLRPGIVFSVDGAGGFEKSSFTIRNTIAELKMPLEVRGFHWTHGYCRVFSDEMHATHMKKEGRRLAELIWSCRHEAPDQPIYLIGHSAGCGLVLNATDNLPPNTLTRIILLAPAVSAKRDLRQALRSSCQGIDVFTSSQDWTFLGLGTLLFGTTDRCWTARTAGKNGFQPIIEGPEDAALYTRLRQYPWDPSLMWTGHKGGHYGSYQPGFLRTFVLPLLQG